MSNPYYAKQAGAGGHVLGLGNMLLQNGMQSMRERSAREHRAEQQVAAYRREDDVNALAEARQDELMQRQADKEQEQMLMEQQQAQAVAGKEQELLDYAANLFEDGEMDELATFMIQNPGVAKAVGDATEYHNEITSRNAGESAFKYAMGQAKAGPLVAERVALLQEQGAPDTEQTEAFLGLSKEERMKQAQLDMMINTPELWETYVEARDIDKPKDYKPSEESADVKSFDYYQELKRTDPEAAREFGQQRGYISKEGRELSGHMQKQLSGAYESAYKAENAAGRYNALADDLESSDFSGGLFGGSWKEKMKEMTGNQDEVTELRKKYYTLRGSRVVANLPPGSASDVDIALALSGFPGDNSGSKELGSFTRGVAKLEQLDADYNHFKADFISSNGHERNMGKEWKKFAAKKLKEGKKAKEVAAEAAVELSIDDLVDKYGG